MGSVVVAAAVDGVVGADVDTVLVGAVVVDAVVVFDAVVVDAFAVIAAAVDAVFIVDVFWGVKRLYGAMSRKHNK